MLAAASCGRGRDGGETPADALPRAEVRKSTEVVDEVDLWRADSVAYRLWGSPSSPYRNDARYVAFLDSLLARDSLPEGLRERAEERRRIAMLNRQGSIANDFRYLERNGGEYSLHDLESPLTLLIFYDPECPHCTDILKWYASSDDINKAIDDNRLTVVAIYAEGKRDVWDKTRNDMPANWLVGYDLSGILDNDLYDLPAMPTPYLLDSNKRVLRKDPHPRLIVKLLRRAV